MTKVKIIEIDSLSKYIRYINKLAGASYYRGEGDVYPSRESSALRPYVANGSFATLKADTKTYKEPNYAVFVRRLDLGAQFCNELSYIDEASYEFLRKSKLYGGELILPNIGASIGKAFIMPDLGMPMSLAPNSVMVKFENNIMNKYFYYVFQSSNGKGILMNIQGGAATPKQSAYCVSESSQHNT